MCSNILFNGPLRSSRRRHHGVHLDQRPLAERRLPGRRRAQISVHVYPDPSAKGARTCDPDAGIEYADLHYWSRLVFVADPVSGLDLPQRLAWRDWFVIDMA